MALIAKRTKKKVIGRCYRINDQELALFVELLYGMVQDRSGFTANAYLIFRS